ncbi:hypothetical protein [Mesoplasma seiffertii]|uniref:hypothetical protein n=1 Tax=Mesoplasma seiffertii TaxID=28224 RepID=UPI00047B17B3|nr:hypothetical protein [Mesoplasma seiffertii]
MLTTKSLIFLPTLATLSIIIFLLNVYLIIEVIKKLRQLNKFKTQEVLIYENKRLLLIINLWIYLIMPLIFALAMITFALFFVVTTETRGVIYGIGIGLFLVYVISAFIFDVWILKAAESAIVVVKNHKLAFLNEVINYTAILSVTNDLKRRKIFINYYDDENEGLVLQMKLRYHWELKDFFKALEISTAFE